MASFSSSSLVPPYHRQKISYDVFVSFRGPDVRHSFLSHLIKAFQETGIDAYVDDRINRGEEISLALLEAIEKSQISLVIFSKNYASSKWCLEELVKIIECKEQNKQIVIPVFYHIEPSDVRHQSGNYGVPFAKHEKRYGFTTVTNWKTASKKAASISGLHLSNFRSEVEFIEEIIQCVLKSLDDKVYQRDLKNLVGIERQLKKVELLLCSGPKDICIVGLWGMGGIGKTTIANALFNKLCSEYKGCCFKANMREELEKYTITDLKIKLLSKLLKEKDPHMAMSLEEPYCFIRRLQRKKALVLLDDVTELENLKFLINEGKDFGLGSLIIVTSRDRQILSHVAGGLIYEVKALDYNEALKLFSLNAFRQEHPNRNWIELSSKVVQYAKGNPLALKVLGSLLLNVEPKEWKSLLERLKKIPCKGIQKVLRLSYDSLERDHQEMFLYLACFFRSGSKESIRILLDACGFSTLFGFRILQSKALITVSKDRIKIHDLIQEMGQEIVCEKSTNEPEGHSHLWNDDDIRQVLMNNNGTKAIQSISLNVNGIKELHLSPQVFKNMVNLKLLKFYSSDRQCRLHLPEGLESLPNQLRLLHWEQYPSKSLPLTFYGENLVDLNMPESRVEKLWDGVPDLPNLKSVNLSRSKHLIRLPDFSKASNLKCVMLNWCDSLVDIHESIFSLHQLVHLRMAYCRNIKSLKSDVRLRSLRTLDLQGCNGLKECFVVSGEMDYLILSFTAIEELPRSIKFLRKLTKLCLMCCENLKHLPKELSELRSLQELYLCNCENLDPSNLCILFDGLGSLQYLSLQNCYNLCELPDNISNLSLLCELRLNGCNVKIIPPSFKDLSKLRTLILDHCRRLQHVTNLPPSIIDLSAYKCKRLQSISAILPSIEYLSASDCKRLKSIELISLSIEGISLSNDGRIQTISTLPPSTESIFELSDNISLLSQSYDLPPRGRNAKIMSASFNHLSWLNKLNLSKCWWLQCISDLPPSIKELNVSNCGRLQCLLELPCSIDFLYAMNCRSLKTVTWFTSMPLLLPYQRFNCTPFLSFMNCINLDEYAVNSIMECAHSITKEISCSYLKEAKLLRSVDKLGVCLPGWKVPDWFRHQTRGSSIRIPLNLSPDSKFMGFICCIIVSNIQSNERDKLIGWECKCYYEASDDDDNYHSVYFVNYRNYNYRNYGVELLSDHILFGYDVQSYLSITNSNESRTHEINILLKFTVKTRGESDIVIKECGVHPLYASEYLNSAKKLKFKEYLNRDLKPESRESITKTEAGSSDGNKQQKAMLPPIHKPFLPIPTGIPKGGTSGLKELLKF